MNVDGVVNVCDVDEVVNDDEVDKEETPESHDWHTTANDSIVDHCKKELFNIRFKFEQQARFMFGVTMLQKDHGMLKGRRLPMYTYTGNKIIGMAKYKEGHETAIDRAKKAHVNVPGLKKDQDNLSGMNSTQMTQFHNYLKSEKQDRRH